MRPARGTLILAAVVAIQLLPIWLLPFFPSQDGPVHMTIARVLRDYHRPEAQVLREYFQINTEAVPNRFIYLVLADVLRFVSVPAAEKILLSAYVILLPLAVRYAVAGVAPGNAFLAVLALPFTFNFLLNMGFYNFSLSLVAFFVALGWWLRHRERFGPRAALVFAGLAMWVYFCHAVSLVALLAAVGAAAVYLEIRLAVEKRSLRGLAWLVLASLPAAALTFFFAGDLGAYRYWLPFPDRLRMLASLTSLTSVDSRIRFLAWLLALSLAGLAAWLLVRRLQEKGLGPSDAPLAAVVALLVLYFLAPEAVGIGSFITYRLILFPYLVLILWLATFEHPARRRLGLQVLGAGVALGMLALLVPRWQEANLYLAEAAPAVERVAPGSTYLPLAFSYGGEAPDGGPVVDRVLPFLHAGDHVSALRTVANLNLFAAGTADAFPIRYRPERDPYKHIWTRDGWVLSGGGIDYVLVWWPRAREPNLAGTRRLLVELEAGYERVYTSPRDLVRLYRRKKMTQSGCPPSAGIVPASLIRRKLSSFRRELTTIRREVPRLDLE